MGRGCWVGFGVIVSPPMGGEWVVEVREVGMREVLLGMYLGVAGGLENSVKNPNVSRGEKVESEVCG